MFLVKLVFCSVVLSFFLCLLFHDVLLSPIFHYSVWSVKSADNLTSLRRDDRNGSVHSIHSQAELTVDHVHEISTFQHVYGVLCFVSLA